MARRTTPAAAARRRLLLLGVGAGLLVLLAAWPAAAHAVLVGSDPAAGSSVAAAPRRLTLTFSEVVEASPGPVTVLGPDRRPLAGVRAGPDPANRTRLVAELPGGLGRGTYEVQWAVLALDGHAVRGAFRFAVGAGAPAPGGPSAPAATGPGPAEIAGRALAVAGALAAFGLAAFPLLVVRPAARRLERLGGSGGLKASRPPVDRGSRAVLERAVARLGAPVRVAVLVSAAGTVLLLVATAAEAAAPAGAEPLGPAAVLGQVALDTRPGRLLLARLALLGALFALAGRRGLAGGRAGPPLTAGLALAALGTFSLTGHAVAVAADAAVAVLLDWTHLAAAGLWTGGLLALATAGRAAAPAGHSRRAGDATAALTSGFSTVAQVAMVAVAATGAYAALVRVDALDDLGGTAWGTELAVKVALWLTVVPVATANALRLVPRISARVGRASQRRAASGELGTVVRLELALAAALLVVAAAMSASSPPATGQPPAPVAAAAPAAPSRVLTRSFAASGGRYRLQVTVERAVDGPTPGSVLDLQLSSEGAPAAATTARVVLGGHGGGPRPVAVTERGEGRWRSDRLELEPGSYRLVARFTRSTGSFSIPVTVRVPTP
jgi:copper transport protein